MARLPTVGGDNNNWGTVLNDYLQQSLNSNGTLVTAATNPYTGLANTNLASATQPGLVQLAGDLTGTAASPALASVVTAGTAGSSTVVPVITYDAKGRITAASTVAHAQATAAAQGTIQLAGDLAGSATSPALANIITAGTVGSAVAIPVITYDAKGRITATSTVASPNSALSANYTNATNTQTATNLSFAIAASESWVVEYQGTVQCSGTGGVAYQINAPTGATIEGWLQSSTNAITTLSFQRITAINTATSTAVHTVGTTPAPDRIWFRVTNSTTAGTVAISAASRTNGQTTTIFAGSNINANKVTLV